MSVFHLRVLNRIKCLTFLKEAMIVVCLQCIQLIGRVIHFITFLSYVILTEI